jgi:triacylglycerol lipase
MSDSLPPRSSISENPLQPHDTFLVEPKPRDGDTLIGPLLVQAGRELALHHQIRASAWSLAQATIGGLFGHRDGPWSPHVPKMAFRSEFQDLDAEQVLAPLAPVFGKTRAIDIALLVHGLLVDEQNWTLSSSPFPDQVVKYLGWAPVMVRYNSGQHIWKNGSLLADRIVDLYDTFGPRMGRIRIIGHSMGGLVSRSAVEHLRRRNHPALNHIDRLFLLATPNHGADLERLGHAFEYLLRTAEEAPKTAAGMFRRVIRRGGAKIGLQFEVVTAAAEMVSVVTGMPFRSILSVVAARSDGMRDVRFGYMTREESESAAHDHDRFMLNHRRPLPAPEHIRVYTIAGSLWPDVGSEPSRLRTDGLVSVASAAGLGEEFDDLNAIRNGRFAELPLLVHQLVASSPRTMSRIREWVRNER